MVVCLLTVAGFEIAGLKFRELGPRLRALPGFAAISPEEGRSHGSGFAFDRRYGEFLESVRRVVPATATVALEAPRTSQLYEFAAAYMLAPRRVVPFSEIRDAQFAAVYGSGPTPGAPVEATVRFGSLGRLR